MIIRTLLSYTAKIVKTEGRYCVIFRDMPFIMTCGQTYQEAKDNAFELLEFMLDSMVTEKDCGFYLPSDPQDDEISIPVPKHLLQIIARKKMQ